MVTPRSCSSARVSVKRASPAAFAEIIPALQMHVPSFLPALVQIVPGDHLDPKDFLQEVVDDVFHHLRLFADLQEVENYLAPGPYTPPP